MERNLDPVRLIQTSSELEAWIKAEFPDAHLAEVAAGVHAFCQEAVARATAIRRPIWELRIGVWGVIGLAVVGAVHQIATHRFREILKFLDETKGAAAWMAGAAVAFMTLEIRWKRNRALKAVNELRALAHVVDMHQLSKDEAIEQFRQAGRTEKIVEYLHACTALLALLSKLGQLYVEHFPDPVAISAVNDFEMIADALGHKIWMKILSMRRGAFTAVDWGPLSPSVASRSLAAGKDVTGDPRRLAGDAGESIKAATDSQTASQAASQVSQAAPASVSPWPPTAKVVAHLCPGGSPRGLMRPYAASLCSICMCVDGGATDQRATLGEIEAHNHGVRLAASAATDAAAELTASPGELNTGGVVYTSEQ